MSATQARPHRAVLKHAPLAPAVFADLSILVERFEVGPGHGLAEFKEAWQQMEFGRIFSTQKLAGRVPGTDETHEEYIVLLLRAATAHLCPNRYPQFEHRLGGIFLKLKRQEAETTMFLCCLVHRYIDLLDLAKRHKGCVH